MINKRKKEWRDKTPEEKYNYIVKNNIDNYCIEPYEDPDWFSTRIEDEIRIKTDGICSIRLIEKYEKKKEEWPSVYKLFRENTYNFLKWPVHKNSINQLRGLCLKDRLDMLLLDLQEFYNVENEVGNSKSFEKLKLKSAYAMADTQNWLRKFGSFDGFINTMHLQSFVTCKNGKFTAEKWAEDEKGYYDNLKIKMQKYKEENNL